MNHTRRDTAADVRGTPTDVAFPDSRTALTEEDHMTAANPAPRSQPAP